MALGGLQQVDETSEHMGADRLALVAAGHHGVVGIDAEMVRPEPHQALDEADLGGDGGVEMRLGLGEEDLLRHGLGRRGRGLRSRGLDGLGRHLGLCLHRPGHAGFGRRALGLLLAQPRDARLGSALGEELEGGAIGSAAGHQAGGGEDLAGIRPVEVGEERAARIGGDGGDRARAGPEAESMQRQRGSLRIEGHDLSPW